MGIVEVVTLNTICRNFPAEPQPEIHREHLLDTIDGIFKDETQIVIVEGLESIGKTILMAQYAKRHSNNAISLFIKPNSRLGYAPEYIRTVLSEQIHWAIHKEALSSETVAESFLSSQLGLLQRRAKKEHETYYFIIDGLYD